MNLRLLMAILFSVMAWPKIAAADLLDDWADVPVRTIVQDRRNTMAAANAAADRLELDVEGKVRFVACLRSLATSREFKSQTLMQAMPVCARLAK